MTIEPRELTAEERNVLERDLHEDAPKSWQSIVRTLSMLRRTYAALLYAEARVTALEARHIECEGDCHCREAQP